MSSQSQCVSAPFIQFLILFYFCYFLLVTLNIFAPEYFHTHVPSVFVLYIFIIIMGLNFYTLMFSAFGPSRSVLMSLVSFIILFHIIV